MCAKAAETLTPRDWELLGEALREARGAAIYHNSAEGVEMAVRSIAVKFFPGLERSNVEKRNAFLRMCGVEPT